MKNGKKRYASTLAAAALLTGSCAFASTAAAAAGESTVQASVQQVHFVFDGKSQALDGSYVALNYNDHVYVPARFVGENMEAAVGWNAGTDTVTFTSLGKPNGYTGDPAAQGNNPPSANALVHATVEPIQFVFDGQPQALGSDYAALNYADHIYVPVRFVGENLGGAVDWDANSSTVTFHYFQGNAESYAGNWSDANRLAESTLQFTSGTQGTVDFGLASLKATPLTNIDQTKVIYDNKGVGTFSYTDGVGFGGTGTIRLQGDQITISIANVHQVAPLLNNLLPVKHIMPGDYVMTRDPS